MAVAGPIPSLCGLVIAYGMDSREMGAPKTCFMYKFILCESSMNSFVESGCELVRCQLARCAVHHGRGG